MSHIGKFPVKIEVQKSSTDKKSRHGINRGGFFV